MKQNANAENSWDIFMTKYEWSKEDDELSKQEGWALFDCEGVCQIQALDEIDEDDGVYLEGRDGEAYDFVTKKALEGSKRHLLALYLDGRKEMKDLHIPRILAEEDGETKNEISSN